MIRSARFFLALVFVFCFGARMAAAETTTVTPPPAPPQRGGESIATTTEPVILLMADGRYYNPASGEMAISRDLLLEKLRWGTTPPPIPPLTPPSQGGEYEAMTTSTSTHPLLDAVRRGQELLREEWEASSTVMQIVKKDDGWRNIELVLWSRSTSGFAIVKARKNGGRLKCLDAECASAGVKVASVNGPQSSYTTNDANVIIVAIRYPLYVEEVLSKRKKQYRVEQIVMTPSSAALNKPEMVKEGERVLSGYMAAAKDFLNAHQVHSRAYPEKMLADVIKPEMAKAVIAVEHTDLTSLRVNARSALDRFFIHIALNPDAPYAADQSSAAALGLAQFIPSTYKRMVATHPELALIADFRLGMRDPENAVRVEIAYLDELLSLLPASARESYLQDPDSVSEFVVAAYNAGPGRVKKAIPLWEDAFKAKPKVSLKALQKKDAQLVKKIEQAKKNLATAKNKKKRATLQAQIAEWRAERVLVKADVARWHRVILKAETIGYVKKYREVADLFLPPAASSALAMAE